jgi:hypothetical protein
VQTELRTAMRTTASSSNFGNDPILPHCSVLSATKVHKDFVKIPAPREEHLLD